MGTGRGGGDRRRTPRRLGAGRRRRGGRDTTAAPTGDVETDPAELGEVTLTVWDQEVRGGQNEQIEALNAAFMEAYPNITIDRVSRSTDDLRTTLRLALSGDDAPDVVQANNSRSEMGQYVAAGLLVPLDEYAEAYGWFDRFPESVRALASYSEDGAVFGEGQLYGLPQMGEIVGLFYNKTKLDELGLEPPATTDDFVAAVEAAQEAGETPVQFGNSEGWPGIHEFGFVQNQFVDAETDPRPRLRPTRLVVDVRRTTSPRPRRSCRGPTPGSSPTATAASTTTPPGRASPRATACSSSAAPGSSPTSTRRWATRSASCSPPPAPAGRTW